tara:strand:+ start:2019 stop:3869 length:1851 start_codon:yes stop_codon:yes gene_type:complete
MTTLYILEEIEETKLLALTQDNSSEFISFDFNSHKILSDRNIAHKLIDNFLTDFDRKKIFDHSNEYLKKIEKFNNSDLNFHGINFINLIDRNELLEFLMDIIPQIHVVQKILKNNNYEKIFLPLILYEIFLESKFKDKIYSFNDYNEKFTTFEKIEIPIRLGMFHSKIMIDRKKYKIIKQIIEEYIGNFFGLIKIKNKHKKIILLEFDPTIYHTLLEEINQSGFEPILINFRKSPIYNFDAIKSLSKSKSTVMIPKYWLTKDQLNEFKKNKIFFLTKINNIIKNKIIFLYFKYDEINFSSFLQKKLNQLLIQRYDEYLMEILVTESIQSRNDVQSILTLNLSGENEKVFSKVVQKHPIILLQHAFANYTSSTSYFDVLDDFDLIKNKIAIWGDVVKNYLVNVKKIDENKILVTGSPKYDFYNSKIKTKTKKKIILVTLRPIINHMEGLRIELFDRYNETLQKIIQISKNNPYVEIIFKLHPQQNTSNIIIKNMIQTNEKIKFFQHESIKKLLENCDLHVNIATDNFDASSVIVEAMLLKRPTLNIQLQNNLFEFEFIVDNAIKTINYNADIYKEILYLLNENNSLQLIKNSQKHLTRYMKHRNDASHTLINAITKF